MKTHLRRTLCLALPLALLAACGGDTSEAQDLRKESAEAWGALKAYATERKDAFVELMQDNGEKLSEEIDALQGRAKELSGDAREKFDAQLEDLDEKRAALAEKMTELKAKSGDAWKEMRDGLGSAYEELRVAVQEAKATLK